MVNPLGALDSPGRYIEVLETKFDHKLRHTTLVERVVGHLLDLVYDPKNNPKSLTKVIKKLWGFWSFSRWFWILLTIVPYLKHL